MRKYNVTGMSCAACVAHVEKAVGNLENVQECSVNLLLNTLVVEGNAKEEEIIKAVENAGYGIEKIRNEGLGSRNEGLGIRDKGLGISDEEGEMEKIENQDISILKKRLISSIIFVFILMYFSMFHSMFGFPLPKFFEHNHIAISLVELILSSIVMFINKKFFVNGFKTLLHKSPTMDTLVALGSSVSWFYSLVILFLMTKPNLSNDESMKMMHNLYFESAAMIVTLITVGKLLEAISKGKTTNALKGLMKLAPKTAIIELSNGESKEIEISQVKIGDIFIVKPGMQIPVDGIVIEGNSSINESALTGESLPVEKEIGSEVSSGTMNTSGFIKCKATRIGNDTTLSKIIQMVSDASSTKAPIAKIADKVSGIFVPTVIAIAFITTIIWILLGSTFGNALSKGICVLVVSCPCALGLATPVAIMVGNGKGAKNGILFKTSESLETAGKTKIVALDKTGTITKGEPEVIDIYELKNENEKIKNDEKSILQIALNLEAKSEHPLAKAIVKKANDFGLKAENVEDFEIVAGKGLKGNLKIENENEKMKYFENFNLLGGNLSFILENVELSDYEKNTLKEKCDFFASEGKTPLIFVSTGENKTIGIITVSDTIKEDSPQAISELKKLGIKTVMLTGDNKITAQAISKIVGVDEVIAGVLPNEKENVIRNLQKNGKVAMVGDGINDAPSLTRADTGIAIGAGTDIAIDAANIVLLNNSIMDVVSAIKLSKATLKNIKQNLFWAFFYNILLIPIAAGVYSKFGLEMTPMFGAAAMSLSSFCVVTNALRLNFVKLNKKQYNDEKIKQQKSLQFKEKNMTIKVEGMMCAHCEKHVKDALEKIDGVTSATASHEKKQVEIELSKEVDSSLLEKAIIDAGYEVIK